MMIVRRLSGLRSGHRALTQMRCGALCHFSTLFLARVRSLSTSCIPNPHLPNALTKRWYTIEPRTEPMEPPALENFLKEAQPLLELCYTINPERMTVTRTHTASLSSGALYNLVDDYFKRFPYRHDMALSPLPSVDLLLAVMVDQFSTNSNARIFIINTLTNCSNRAFSDLASNFDTRTLQFIVKNLANLHKLPKAVVYRFPREAIDDLLAGMVNPDLVVWLTTMRFITTLALGVNEPLLAVAMFLKHPLDRFEPKTLEPLQESTMNPSAPSLESIFHDLASALLVSNPKYDEYSLDALVKLLTIAETSTVRFSLTYTQTVQLFQNLEALGGTQSNHIDRLNTLVINNLLGYLEVFSGVLASFHSGTLRDKRVLLTHIYGFLRRQMRFFNNGCVYLLWLRIKPLEPLASHDLDFLNALFKFLGKQRVYHHYVAELISELPCELYAHPSLVETLLHFSARTKNQELSQEILIQLKVRGLPLERSTLSGLLHTNLVFQNTAMAEKILQEIFGSEQGLQFFEFNMLIESILKEDGGVPRAAVMCRNVSVELAKSAYVTILNHMVSEKKLDPGFVGEMLGRFETLPEDDSVRERLVSVYFKYLVNTFPLMVAQRIYINSFHMVAPAETVDPSLRLLRSGPLVVPPFLMSRNDTVRSFQSLTLVIPPHMKFFLLGTILDKARSHYNFGMMKWGLFELYNDGAAPLEILVDWSKRYGTWFRKIGFQQLPLKRTGDAYETDLLTYWSETGIDEFHHLVEERTKM
ncbi:hypothetical protein BABINDRAFT_161261 [Babjeviella inositovora NRRL Y-12698]|uniref:Uncharacterized protein n=1 Tax=Babjeviella inositovora NRRL Y-12698 TaxID=984486 RepID=A0A1E3QRH3_9ASCO|nr:uncharacterized protein BABINDRAFT_161261 [Babjeviella inositovora NRRL Y-12698]ODQ80303.1 hypothetical protein BABINDRAFT_161261 [Babjeviella inositovora NRRL Y-12698]